MTLAPRRRPPPAHAPTARAAFTALALTAGPLAALPGCGNGASPPEPEPCDQQCLDTSAVRALRETIKLAFNLTLQGKPVGAHDVTVPCPFGGSIRVYGEAYSNPIQGATEVTLTYELAGCAYKQIDSESPENYSLAMTGALTQEGTIAVQPTATTALLMKSTSMTFAGSVYDPPITYEAPACALDLVQNGSRLSGTICGRDAGYDL